MKLVALVITLGLWLGVTVLNKQGSGRFSIPLTFRVSDDAILTNSPVREIGIWIKGDDRKIEQLLSGSDLKVFVDLTQVEPGDKIITLTSDNVVLPQGVRLEEMQPSHVPVSLEPAAQKDIMVRAETDGNPADGFEIYAETVMPPRIRIRGPASYVGKLEFLQTEKVDITGRKADFSAKQVPVDIANEYTSASDTVVDVAFKIGEKRVEKTFSVPVPGIPVKSTARIVLYGPRTLLSKVRPENLKVEVVKNDRGEDTPNLILPESLQGNVEIRKVKIN
jgi:YbbR domain-containing protein